MLQPTSRRGEGRGRSVLTHPCVVAPLCLPRPPRYSALSPALGPHWIQTMVYTATVFPGGCVMAVFLMNLVAWGYHSPRPPLPPQPTPWCPEGGL